MTAMKTSAAAIAALQTQLAGLAPLGVAVVNAIDELMRSCRCSCGYVTTDKALFEFHLKHEHLGPVEK